MGSHLIEWRELLENVTFRRAASEVSERHPEMPALFKRAHYQLGYVDMSVPVPARIYGVLWCEQCLYC